MRLIVIGGGPAGLMAAGQAAIRGSNVMLLEKNEHPARKLRLAGNGRCNLTNHGEPTVTAQCGRVHAGYLPRAPTRVAGLG